MIFAQYNFFCSFENETILPGFKGSTFRGTFGHALKKVICAQKFQECNSCLLWNQCLYPLIFETPNVGKPPDSARFAAVPHPFVIQPPMTNRTRFSEGDDFNFNLLLFGEINKNLPYFIYTFDQMGKIGVGKKVEGYRGFFKLKEIHHENRPIYSSKDNKLNMHDLPETLKIENIKSETDKTRIRVFFDTPLRFKNENHLSEELPFHRLIRLILRRISSLMITYGNGEPDMDYKGIVRRAQNIRTLESTLKWYDWRRYSNRQEQDMNFGGLIGSVMYEGDMNEFLPLIQFSEKVHIGKQTTFGLGKMRVSYE